MPSIFGSMVVKNGIKQVIYNFSNARKKTYAQVQAMSDAEKQGVIICDDYPVDSAFAKYTVSKTTDNYGTFAITTSDIGNSDLDSIICVRPYSASTMHYYTTIGGYDNDKTSLRVSVTDDSSAARRNETADYEIFTLSV